MDQNDIKKRKEELAKNIKSQPLELVPFYSDIKNEIIKPERVQIVSQYFLNRWVPYLGPTLSMLVIKLRSHCYYNKITKEKRDWCYPSQERLADELGVHWHTIRRELAKTVAKHFIKREHKYVYNNALKKLVRTTDKYIITMDDPLFPEDEGLVVEKSIERMLKDDLTINLIGRSKKSVDNPPPNYQNDSYIYNYQNDSVISTNIITNNVNNVAQSAIKNNVSNDPLIEDMVNYLGDKKSLGFYRKIAKTCPAQLVYRALGETKEAALNKKIKTTKGAYFTDLIKRLAKEQRVKLNLKGKE